LRGLHDRFEQVILITHIEPVREGLDRVISVSYDADQGSSVVSQSDNEGVGMGDNLRPRASESGSATRRRLAEDLVESAEAGAGAGA
jgi:hypothetical protein